MDLIEGDTMRIGTAEVSPGASATIRGESNEKTAKDEPSARFDILFRSMLPKTEDRRIAVNIHLNFEFQEDAYPGYPLEKKRNILCLPFDISPAAQSNKK